MAEWPPGSDGVAVAPAVAGPSEVAGRLEVGDDLLHRALGNSDPSCHLAQRDLRIARNREQDMCVVCQERPSRRASGPARHLESGIPIRHSKDSSRISRGGFGNNLPQVGRTQTAGSRMGRLPIRWIPPDGGDHPVSTGILLVTVVRPDRGAGIGKVMAEWVVSGDPGLDVWHMDVARFGRQY